MQLSHSSALRDVAAGCRRTVDVVSDSPPGFDEDQGVDDGEPEPESASRAVEASRIGKAVEHLVAASCILASDMRLNVSTALVDDEGVDLVFHQRLSTSNASRIV
jgi:hypothetical protein